MKKRIIIIISLIIVAIAICVTAAVIVNKNNSNTNTNNSNDSNNSTSGNNSGANGGSNEKEDDPKKLKWNEILTKFDKEADIVTITYSDDLNDSYTIKKENNKYEIKYKEEMSVFFKDDIYRFYYDAGWNRIDFDMKDITNYYPFDLKYEFNLSQYINQYNNFKYNKDNGYYEALNITLDNKIYDYIGIKMDDERVRGYVLILDGNRIEYGFTNFNITKVYFPNEYIIVYQKLDSVNWQNLLDQTKIIDNFTMTKIYEEKVEEVEVSKLAHIYKINPSIQEAIINEEMYLYKLESHKWLTYKNTNGVYVEDLEYSLDEIKTTQNQFIPYELLSQNYDKLEYNKYDNYYMLTDIVYEGKLYNKLMIKLENNHIAYVNITTSFLVDGALHTALEIISFTDFNETEINGI